LPKADELRSHAHDAIRLHTRRLHDALDSRLVLSNLTNRMGYVDYLLINWPCVSIEEALERAGIDQVLLDWERRRRRAALVKDLEGLGVRPPSYAALTIDSDIGSLLGWSYVLEGSRLGARVILQTLMTSAEPDITRVTAFLRHGGGERLWESFKVEMAKINDDPAAIAKACTGATAAFKCFAPQPH
jgi:heme oxygenase